MGEVDDGERTASQYDAMAAEYATANATGAYNSLYERPATIALWPENLPWVTAHAWTRETGVRGRAPLGTQSRS
jgi:hypothetical protein